MGVLDHRVRLADAGRGADVDPQPRALRRLQFRQYLLAGRPVLDGRHLPIVNLVFLAIVAFYELFMAFYCSL
jgi:hypothetical protein